jgi:hypothetical protein
MEPQNSPISTNDTFVFPVEGLDPNTAPLACAGLLYANVVRPIDDEDILVRVAGLLDRIGDKARSYVVIFKRSLLSKAFTLDDEARKLPTCELRELVQAHASTDIPLPESALQDTTSSSHSREEAEADLIPLPELFVSCETMQTASGSMGIQAESATILFSTQKRNQLCWLRAALLGLQRQIALAKNHPHLMHFLKKLDALIRHVLVSHRYLHRWILNATPVIVGDRLVGWRLRVGYPLKPTV